MLQRLIVMVLVFLFCLPVVRVSGDEKPSEKTAGKATAKSAKCYTLISGKSDEMCRLFEQNLNRFCEEPPMVCERKIHTDFAGYFSFPDWEQVDPATHLDIIADYIRARAPKYALCAENDEQCQAEWREKKWQEYKAELLERMKAGEVRLSRAVMYIFAKKRLVYRLLDFPCSPHDPIYWNYPPVPRLFAVDVKTGKFDPEFTAIKSMAFDVVFYKDKNESYITEWEGGFPVLDSGKLSIDLVPYIACMFEYTNKKGAMK